MDTIKGKTRVARLCSSKIKLITKLFFTTQTKILFNNLYNYIFISFPKHLFNLFFNTINNFIHIRKLGTIAGSSKICLFFPGGRIHWLTSSCLCRERCDFKYPLKIRRISVFLCCQTPGTDFTLFSIGT